MKVGDKYKSKEYDEYGVVKIVSIGDNSVSYVKADNTYYTHITKVFNELFEKVVTDTIVESVITQFKDRSSVGITKYGVTLDRDDLTPLEWLEHAQQEAMDFCLYLERLKKEFNNQNKNK